MTHLQKIVENDYILIELNGRPLWPGMYGKCDAYGNHDVLSFELGEEGFVWVEKEALAGNKITPYDEALSKASLKRWSTGKQKDYNIRYWTMVVTKFAKLVTQAKAGGWPDEEEEVG